MMDFVFKIMIWMQTDRWVWLQYLNQAAGTLNHMVREHNAFV